MALLNRSFIPRNPGQPQFKVMTWNLLADQLAKDFPKVKPEYLNWEYRNSLILSEIERINSDLLFTQELDHYSDFLDPYMRNRGFSSIFKQKSGWHRDGIAIFYRDSLFESLQSYEVSFPGSQFAIGLKLRFRDHIFYAFTTHLKAKSQFDNIRVEQVAILFEFLSKLEPYPIIIGGDFNSIPGSNAYFRLAENSLGLKSVYNLGDEPEYTTVKFRKALEIKTEDYLWTTGFEINSHLSLPSKEEIGENGLPMEHYPSDHFSLSADLEFTR